MQMIEFSPMDETDFQEYLERSIQEYADENVRVGAWDREGALEKSRKTFDQLLPDGRSTEGHRLLLITDTDRQANVGIIWYMMPGGLGGRGAYICDLRIDEAHRRQGYGRRALLHLEDELAEQGVSRIGLHVFSDNAAARSLYESVGYAATGVNMVKRVNRGPA
jgi:ribosomal protein S18 acetylase RimI-like enzyme